MIAKNQLIYTDVGEVCTFD